MKPVLSKNDRTSLATRYLAALRIHLQGRRTANGDGAQGLGRTVLAGGLVTRDVALMHEHAMIALAPSHDFGTARNGSLVRAGYFFTQALIPLEAAQRATRKSNRLLQERNATLREHTANMARSNRRLEKEITRRKTGETSILKGRAQYQQLFLESEIMQRKLRQLTRQIIVAQEEERKEISRELHDEVVQTLVGINVQLSALGKGADNGLHSLKAKIASTQRLVEHSVNAVHQFARKLRPVVLDDLGLIPALHAYSKNMAAREKIQIHLTAFGGVEALGNAKRTVLYRVAQEALTNVARHAQASQVGVKITKLGGMIRLEISDNGKSFAVEKTLGAKTNKRLGVIGMRERIEMVGGTFAIDSQPGRGTTVRAEVPFNPKKI